ncbi:MAG TPA: TauD/TfdA family dioxygenase [Streptosporangiaceae bacterium]
MTSAPTEIPALPGGWHGTDLAADPDRWRLPLPDDVRDDLLRAAAEVTPEGGPRGRRPAVSERTRALVGDIYHRLAGEPGLVVLGGFPVGEEPDLVERAYVLLGMLLGQPVAQTLDGRLLVRVEAYDPGVKVPGAQNTGIPNAQPFHIDRAADVVGLLCIRRARAGGLSLVVSSRTVHNTLAERHPDLLPVLYRPIPVQTPPLRGPAGEVAAQWCEVPVFSQVDGHFAAYCDRHVIDMAQRFPDAPRLTERQEAALAAVDEVVALPGLALEMSLEPGDLQLINNLSVLHARTAYEGDPAGQGRLLLRLHIAFGGSPALPAEYTAVYGATAPGSFRGGLLRTPEVQRRLGTPLPAS